MVVNALPVDPPGPPALVALPEDTEPLGRIDPVALRAMDPAELTTLAARVRRFLIATLATTGGHLGPNLGVVELTIVLHRVFESPADPIVWDTGHQAYVHKLVTGRAPDFGRLRQADGLSGYPNREESVHDHVENSHASTALSYAYGMARARQLAGSTRPVVAVVGDGAMTGGLAYEALNNIGVSATPVVIVLNDNGRSYAPTVSSLCAGEGGDGAGASAAAFFGALGIAYHGPVDGHCLGALEEELRRAASTGGPVVLHVLTKKGLGYGPAEADAEKRLHDVSPFDPLTGRPRPRPGNGPSYTEAFGRAILAEAADRPELVAVTAAMPGPTGLLPFAERYPERFFDVGIAEQHAVTAAAGMAMAGLRPVVAIYSTFLNRAWDQVYFDVGLHRLPVVFCIDRAGITGDDGPSHHGLLDLALLTKVPGMTVLVPSAYEEVAEMLRTALDIDSGPVAIRWPKTAAPRSPVTGHALRARLLRRGSDVCLIGVGKLLASCQEAAERLAASGVRTTVWDARAVAPLDPAMLADAARHPLVLVAEDGVAEGAVASVVRSALEGLTPDRPPAVVGCGVPLVHVPHGRADDLLADYGLDGAGLAATVSARLLGTEVRPQR